MGRCFKKSENLTAAFIFLCATLFSTLAYAELRAFRLKITDATTGTERFVISRLDHIQYRDYFAVKSSEQISIDQTWMCYQRSDYAGALCQAPERTGPVSGDQDRSPAGSPAGNLNSP